MYHEIDFIPLYKSLRSYRRSLLWARCLVMLIEAKLYLFGLKKTEKMLSLFLRKAKPPETDTEVVLLDRYTTLFNEIKRMPYLKGRCLSQSLAMRFILNRKGIESELRIGVSINNGLFNAHAWLERKKLLLNDHPSIISTYFILPEGKINSALKFK
ncbi:MAG: hypothetical protein JWR67_776 [Mucilaginibacter sp.]|nr:hypothetical protein [Mucilaginibacter sp.]MDB5109662.1 hypothetical protein [Mucilaginibacter sp.]